MFESNAHIYMCVCVCTLFSESNIVESFIRCISIRIERKFAEKFRGGKSYPVSSFFNMDYNSTTQFSRSN